MSGLVTLTLSRLDESALKTWVMLEYSFQISSPALSSPGKRMGIRDMAMQYFSRKWTGRCLNFLLMDQQAPDFVISPGMNITEFT
jgi:hypothetical protein